METYAQESLLLQAGQAKLSSTLPAAHAITQPFPAALPSPRPGMGCVMILLCPPLSVRQLN
jgi:hypothetical protein